MYSKLKDKRMKGCVKMTTKTMTIHEALGEIKLLEKRIQKAVSETTFISTKEDGVDKISGMSIPEYTSVIKSQFDSITDMVRLYLTISKAIQVSNLSTKVTICDKEYTVAEAIFMKQRGCSIMSLLPNKVANNLMNAQRKADLSNGELLDRAEHYILSMYSTKDIKNLSDEQKKTKDDFIKNHTVSIFDPLNLSESSAKELESQMDFMSKVDIALSISNAKTEITIEW